MLNKNRMMADALICLHNFLSAIRLEITAIITKIDQDPYGPMLKCIQFKTIAIRFSLIILLWFSNHSWCHLLIIFSLLGNVFLNIHVLIGVGTQWLYKTEELKKKKNALLWSSPRHTNQSFHCRQDTAKLKSSYTLYGN